MWQLTSHASLPNCPQHTPSSPIGTRLQPVFFSSPCFFLQKLSGMVSRDGAMQACDASSQLAQIEGVRRWPPIAICCCSEGLVLVS